jgi:2-iminobutanoate/2-iminopropanoate deaminase
MSQSRQSVETSAAPAAIGPYSQAICHADLLFCSGQIPIEPSSGDLVRTSIAAETEQCLRNLQAICAAAGTDLGATIRATIYTTELDRFDEINDAYGAFFPSAPPARAAVGVAMLPKGARVEIDAIVAVTV